MREQSLSLWISVAGNISVVSRRGVQSECYQYWVGKHVLHVMKNMNFLPFNDYIFIIQDFTVF